MIFIERVLHLLSENNITKNKMLKDLGLGKNSFVNWTERGSIPNGETLSKIADYFNCPVDYLLGRIDAPQILNTGDINNNSGVIGQTNAPVTINQQTPLSTQEQDFLRIYNSVDGKTQTKIMSMLYDIEEDTEKK